MGREGWGETDMTLESKGEGGGGWERTGLSLLQVSLVLKKRKSILNREHILHGSRILSHPQVTIEVGHGHCIFHSKWVEVLKLFNVHL